MRANLPGFFGFVRFALAVAKAVSLIPGGTGRLTRTPLCDFPQAAKLRAVGGNQHVLPPLSRLLYLSQCLIPCSNQMLKACGCSGPQYSNVTSKTAPPQTCARKRLFWIAPRWPSLTEPFRRPRIAEVCSSRLTGAPPLCSSNHSH